MTPSACVDSDICCCQHLGYACGGLYQTDLRERQGRRPFVCHIGIAALILVGIRLLELLISWLWKSNNPLLFDLVPLKWFFHALDVGVLLVFGFYGIVSVAKSFRE